MRKILFLLGIILFIGRFILQYFEGLFSNVEFSTRFIDSIIEGKLIHTPTLIILLFGCLAFFEIDKKIIAIKDYILGLPDETIRKIVWVTCFSLIILRLFFASFQKGIDSLSLMLLSLGLLAILKEDFASLIRKIEFVNIGGVNIPTSLKENLDKLEDQEEYQKHAPSLKKLYEKYLKDIDTFEARIIQIEYILEDNLRQLFRIIDKDSLAIPNNKFKLLKVVNINKGINNDVAQVIETYFKLREKSPRIPKNDAPNLQQIGLRILRILETILIHLRAKSKKDFFGRPTKIDISKEWLIIKEETIALYTSVSIFDELNQPFPVSDLSLKNFIINESTNNNKELPVELLDLKSLASSIVPIRIIIAIDASPSMIGRKLQYAKEAAVLFINQLSGKIKDKNVDIKIAILPFYGNNMSKKSFIMSGKDIWHENISFLKTEINNINLANSTPLWDAIDISLETLASTQGYPLLICLTDGDDNSSLMGYDTLKEKINNLKIPIYTIGYNDYDSEESNFEDFPKLIEISELSGAGEENIGSFIQILPLDLPNLFSKIATSISNIYEITWRPSSLPKGSDVIVDIRIQYEKVPYGKYNMKKTRTYKKK